jgi:hypothetical protein
MKHCRLKRDARRIDAVELAGVGHQLRPEPLGHHRLKPGALAAPLEHLGVVRHIVGAGLPVAIAAHLAVVIYPAPLLV